MPKTDTEEMDHLTSIEIDSEGTGVNDLLDKPNKTQTPLFAETIFTARCRHRHGTMQDYHFAADDALQAQEMALGLCERNMMKLVYVSTFLTDMATETIK